MNINTEELHMLEWSRTDKRFNTTPLVTGLANNQLALMGQIPSDYLTVWIGPKEVCDAMVKAWSYRLQEPPRKIDFEGAPV